MAEKSKLKDDAGGFFKGLKAGFGKLWNAAAKFFKGLKAEFRKIIWPGKEQIGKQTLSVVIISIITCVVIRIIDIVAQYIVTGAGSIF